MNSVVTSKKHRSPLPLNGRRTSLLLAIFGIAMGVFCPTTSRADGLRCGTNLIQPGDSTYEVRKACGEPSDKQQRVELRSIRERSSNACNSEDSSQNCSQTRSRTVEVVIDEWTYDKSSTKFIRFLTFEQGRLVRMTSGGRGR